jgi:hypothetical protein
LSIVVLSLFIQTIEQFYKYCFCTFQVFLRPEDQRKYFEFHPDTGKEKLVVDNTAKHFFMVENNLLNRNIEYQNDYNVSVWF